MVYRTDRYGRGGDQVPFLDAGFPAVRVTEAHEDYTRQHQDLRVENGIRYGDTIDGVDFDYLAQVTRLNVVALAAMARAPAPPTGVAIEGAVTPHTTLRWQASPGAAAYRVWWRAHDRAAMDRITATCPRGRRGADRDLATHRDRRLVLRRLRAVGRRPRVAGRLSGRRRRVLIAPVRSTGATGGHLYIIVAAALIAWRIRP